MWALIYKKASQNLHSFHNITVHILLHALAPQLVVKHHIKTSAKSCHIKPILQNKLYNSLKIGKMLLLYLYILILF